MKFWRESEEAHVNQCNDTDFFCQVVQNIWLQGHVHVDGAGHPAQLALSHIEYSVHAPRIFARNLNRNAVRQAQAQEYPRE